jgi:hypothetical protein
MSAHTSILTDATPSDADAPAGGAEAWERALLDRQLERLDRLADMGLAIAGAIQRRATAAEGACEPDTALDHAAMDFARVSRAVRMTLALQSRLVRDFKTPIKAVSAKADNGDEDVQWEVVWEPEPPTRDQQRAQARRVVRRVGEDCGLDAETVERLDAEARERLERDDIYADILARPFSEVVADLCRDLGLSPDWSRLAQERWAKDEIKSGKAGWPLLHLPRAAAGGGPSAERSEEPMVEGAGHARHCSVSLAAHRPGRCRQTRNLDILRRLSS